MFRPMWIVQEIATELHRTQCKCNHTDGCSWYYGTWGETATYAHGVYYKKADKLLEQNEKAGILPETVLTILKLM